MRCPNPELLAAAAEGRLDRTDAGAILDHAADCDDCRHSILILQSADSAQADARPRPAVRTRVAPRSAFPWAVAALLLMSVAALVILARPPAPPVEEIETPKVAETPVPPKPPEPRVAPLPAPQTPPSEPVRPVEPPVRKDPSPGPKPEEKPALPETPAPAPPIPPVPPRPQTQPPPPAESPKPPTVTVLATLDRADGEVFVTGAGGKTRAKAGQTLKSGEGLECDGARSLALVAFPDRTRVEVSGETVLREIAEAKGKRIVIERGTVKAEVSKQPEGHPMIFASANGEARVLGTVLRVIVEPDPKGGQMRLEVDEGKVQLKRTDGRTLDVTAGHSAVAAAGAPLAMKVLPREETLLAFDFEDGRLPALVETGTVERGPGNRICLAGAADATGGCKIFIGDAGRGLFTYTGEEVVSFDYWVDPQAAQVNFNVWNRTAAKTFEGAVPKVVNGKWTHVSMRLADFGDPLNRLKEGDWVVNFYIQGTGGGPRRFYLDNLQFTRPRIVRPVETKR